MTAIVKETLPARWYVHIRPATNDDGEFSYSSVMCQLIRARKVEEMFALTSVIRASVILRADKFVAGLYFDLKTKVLSDRNGNEVPYKDLT